MNLNYSKILFIILISIFISIAYNNFNPNGLSLIRQATVLNWVTDSLSNLNNDSVIVDSISSKINHLIDSVVIKKKSETVEPVESFREPRAIKLDLAYKLFNQNIKFIDARSPEEFAEGHIKGAINIPFYGSEKYINVINHLNKNEIIVVYCSSADCDVSTLSGNELFEMGFKKVYVFIAGYDEWLVKNYPTSKIKK